MNLPDQQYAAPPESAENQSGEHAEQQQEFATPETEQHEGERQEGDEQQPEQKQESEVEKIKRATQRRIDRLTRDRATAAAERDLYRKQVEEYQSRQQGGPENEQTTQSDPQAIARQAVEAERFNYRCNDIFEKGAKEIPNFQAALDAVREEAPFIDDKGRPTSILQAIVDTDHPHKVLHYLSQNPDLAAELADMSPTRQARRLGQIERDMEKPKAAPSTAPKPLQPVKPTSTKPAASPEDTDRWIAERNRQQYGR